MRDANVPCSPQGLHTCTKVFLAQVGQRSRCWIPTSWGPSTLFALLVQELAVVIDHFLDLGESVFGAGLVDED